jgi:hypothetical protein
MSKRLVNEFDEGDIRKTFGIWPDHSVEFSSQHRSVRIFEPRWKRNSHIFETIAILLWVAFVVLVLLNAMGCRAEVPSKVDVPNLHKVTSTVWRSAQPTTAEHWRQLKSILGPGSIVIKLDCENEGSDNLGRLEGFDVRDLCIEPTTDPDDLIEIYQEIFDKPDEEKMRLIENVLVQECRAKNCLIHCVHGEDRTGVVAAMARVLLEGWTKDQAITEAHRLGMRWYVFVGLDRWWHDWRLGK